MTQGYAQIFRRNILAITPFQDFVQLDSHARMNVPGVAEGNWGWRLPPGALKAAYAKRLRHLAELTNRMPAAGR